MIRFAAKLSVAALLVLFASFTAVGGMLRLAQEVVPQVSLPAISLPGIALPGSAATSDETQAAIKRVIERANQEQQDAFARRDPSVMRDTATSTHYDEMVQVNSDLASGGITSIELLKIDFGPITVDGTTAQATTYETWRSTYRDGSTQESTDENDYTLVLDGGAWKIQSDDQPGTQPSGVGAPGQPQPLPAAAIDSGTSSNWSGYYVTGGTYTSVSGSWVVARPSSTTAGADATWVGIGGVTSRDLIQAGTQATVSDGTVEYEAWIETLPDNSHPVPLTVRPGDTVTVTLTDRGGGDWSISIQNDTTSKSYGTTVRYASSHSSAEWVEEAPSGGRRILPLDDFGTVRFTGGSAVRNGRSADLASIGAKPITMINGARQPIATTSALGSDGSFTVTRTSASSGPGGGSSPRRYR